MKLIYLFAGVLIPAAYGTTVEEAQLGCRRSIMMMSDKFSKELQSPVLPHDRAEDLVDAPETMVKKTSEMERNMLKQGKTIVTPWSDSYWPMYQGGLGQRYNDPDFRNYDWKSALDYVKANPATDLIRRNETELLSPAEKYDAFLGLEDFPLTHSTWQSGSEFYRRSGKVESWMGLCHGWAPASFMMPEPKKNILVKGPLGEMTLHPSDIKSYATLLWAKGNYKTKFIGGRCNSQSPERDRQNRVSEPDCLDNNPGTFHLAVVNQIGISKRPFIMDASYSYQVWNHPVYSYQYTYIDPKSREDVATLEKATVFLSDWRTDPRKKYRALGAKSIVGIRMSVTYGVENSPNASEDQERESSTAEYEYDLELDGQGQIIGGEWYSEVHPDFLWVPIKNTFPGGNPSEEFNMDLPSPRSLQEARAQASNGVTLAPLVKALFHKSAR